MHIDVKGVSADLTLLSLYPFMAHPENPDAREQFGAFLVAKLHAGVNLPISGETLTRVIEAAGAGVGNDLVRATRGGCIAGDVLLIRLEMISSQVKDAGIDKAQHVASVFYAKSLDGAGKKFKAGRETVRDHWEAYRRVAHLWAAYLILLRDAEDKGIRNDVESWLNGTKLARISIGLKNLADKIVTTRRASSILPKNAFEVVGLAALDISPPEGPERFSIALSTFESRLKTS